MPRARQQIPTYLNRRGRGAVIVYRGGVRTEITLPGKYGSKESRQEYEAILAQLRGSDGDLPEDPALRVGLTIGELVDKFMDHAEVFYVHPGTKEPTGEMPVLRAAFRALLRLHLRTPAATFGPLALKALRNALITGSWQTPEEQAQLSGSGGQSSCRERRPIIMSVGSSCCSPGAPRKSWCRLPSRTP